MMAASPTQVASLASMMARSCERDRIPMSMQYVALGCVAVMAAVAVLQIVRDSDPDARERRR